MKVHIDYLKLPKEYPERRGKVDFETSGMIITIKRDNGGQEEFRICEKGEE